MGRCARAAASDKRNDGRFTRFAAQARWHNWHGQRRCDMARTCEKSGKIKDTATRTARLLQHDDGLDGRHALARSTECLPRLRPAHRHHPPSRWARMSCGKTQRTSRVRGRYGRQRSESPPAMARPPRGAGVARVGTGTVALVARPDLPIVRREFWL
jgi:hypothetical protein